MDQLATAAAGGLRSRLEALDLLAHNMANASTPGFKADREMYRQYFSEEALGEDRSSPVIEGRWTDFSQGALTPTGNTLDFGLSGKGFFTINGPNGPLYTRNGNFHLAADGRIVTADGYEVEIRTEDGQKFKADPALDLRVTADGAIHQGGREAGRFVLVDFAATVANEKRPGNYFSFDTPQPQPASGVEVHQGRIEQANVPAAETAVRLVNVMRQFEMLNRAIALGGEMNKKAVDEVARVNG
ncbi:MAG: flagellar hook basal-body protein [Bryobacteraceae bacterium]|nr:flagellar hook basal-body protein [Bryobacteraceae bacterium]